MKFSIEDFFSKYEQIQRKLQIWSHLLKKSLMENFLFCAVIDELISMFELKDFCLFYCQYHCVKSVRIRSFFWSVFSRIRGKTRARKTQNIDTFYAVYVSFLFLYSSLLYYSISEYMQHLSIYATFSFHKNHQIYRNMTPY